MLQQFLDQIYDVIHICPNFVINVLEIQFFDFLESFLSCFQKLFTLDIFIIIIAVFLMLSSAYKFVSRLSFFQKIKLFFLNKITDTECHYNDEKSRPYFNYAPIDLSNDHSDPSFQEQFRQLDFYLQDQKVKNLAIFGSFGSGKSSLIETYFNSRKFRRKESSNSVIYISLPDFEYENNTSESQQNNFYHKKQEEINESESEQNLNNQDTCKIKRKGNEKSYKLDIVTVENEIIRQIIYSKINKNIPISVISNLKFDKKFVTKFCLLIFCFVFFYIQLKYNDNFNVKHYLQFSCYSTAAFICFFYFVHFVINWIFQSFKLSNVSFQSNGVSVEHKSKSCLFDSYIDEITYLFEESKCEYVVFEDLDRTDNYEVLTHLRNLNQILNNDPRCKDCFSIKQRKIVFIYVVNSSIFKISNETVKFFDASINVSPVVTSTNSWQFLINFRNNLYFYYEKGKDPNSFKHEFFSKHLLDDQFLIAISRYLKDLRVVKEIFNDYQNVIEKIGWLFLQISDQNLRKKLVVQCFSFALFRCILTKEYDNLNINKGTTYNLLNRKYECQNLEPFEIENKSFYE